MVLPRRNFIRGMTFGYDNVDWRGSLRGRCIHARPVWFGQLAKAFPIDDYKDRVLSADDKNAPNYCSSRTQSGTSIAGVGLK